MITDVVNHPQHYTMGKFEVIDVIEDWKLPYHLGNVIKYVARSPYKGRQLDDLKKARWYLTRYIESLEKDTKVNVDVNGVVPIPDYDLARHIANRPLVTGDPPDYVPYTTGDPPGGYGSTWCGGQYLESDPE